MFNSKKNKIKEGKNAVSECDNYSDYEIDLNTLFYVIKYGSDINLKVKITDLYEDGLVLALGRILELDGIIVKISQWATWTINITLYHGGEEFKVAESFVPNENINWDRSSNFINYYPKLNWVEKGNWCRVLYDRFNSLKSEIDNYRNKTEKDLAIEKAKKQAIEDEKNVKKRHAFQDIYK